MKQNHLERIRRDESDKFDEAIRKDPTADTGFQPERPWNRCFDLAVLDKEYWDDHVKTPCFQVATKIKDIGDFIDGDVLIGSNSASSLHGIDLSALDVETRRKIQQRQRETKQRPEPKLKAKPPPPRGKNAQQKKPEACRAYNAGKCKSRADGKCPTDPEFRLHVCSICTSPKHSAKDCPKQKDKGGKGGKRKHNDVEK